MKQTRITILLLVILIALPINVSATTKDEASNWYYGNVSDWARPELVSAVTNGIANDESLFVNCSRNITRKEFATLVVNLYESIIGKELYPASTDSFTDTTDVNILKAYNYGIINGEGNKKFAPNDSVTREQMAVMIYKAVEIIHSGKDYSFHKGDGVLTVADKSNVSSWATNQVDYALENKIITGDGINFNPKRTAPIEQAVAIVNRVYNKYNPYFEAQAEAKAEAEAKAKAEAEAKAEAKAKAEAEAKAEAKAKAEAEARKTIKYTADDIISFHRGYYGSIEKSPNTALDVLRLYASTEDGREEGKLVFGTEYTDVDMTACISLDSKDGYYDGGIMLRADKIYSGHNEHNGYFIGIQSDGDVVFGYHNVDSGWHNLKTFDTNLNPWKGNKLRVKAVGSKFTIYVNDNMVGNITDSTYSSGKVGLRSWNGSVHYFGIVVKDLD